VTETVTTTLGPNGRWNAAALGIEGSDAGLASARTWGHTRTRRNFEREGTGYVCFVHDPVVFARAAMTVVEHDDPVPEAALAWAEIEAEKTDAGERGGTEWADWALSPTASALVDESVPLINRGHAAVVEATVAASRLDVPEYDDAELRARLDYFADVVERAGGEREQEALTVVAANSAWEP